RPAVEAARGARRERAERRGREPWRIRRDVAHERERGAGVPAPRSYEERRAAGLEARGGVQESLVAPESFRDTELCHDRHAADLTEVVQRHALEEPALGRDEEARTHVVMVHEEAA